MTTSGKKPSTLLLIALALACMIACRSESGPSLNSQNNGPAGEPENYSATVVRIIEEGGRREESFTRMARSGDILREEWTEAGETRALIFRPDLGKSFLLSIDRKMYVESEINPNVTSDDGDASSQKNENGMSIAPDAIERAVDSAPSPVSVETRALPDQTIGDHNCEVTEKRATFAEGHVEVIRTFRSRELAGLAIRVESESGGARITTERRDLKTAVAPDAFTVPPGFQKVEKLLPR